MSRSRLFQVRARSQSIQSSAKFENCVYFPAVFDAVSSGTPYALVPQQNSTFGSVIETYDNLRRPAVGSSVFIRGETTMSIQHCLAVRPGVKQEDITRIVSHEQVCCRTASLEA